MDYEEEWWQHTSLSESNANGERLWFNSPDTDTNFLVEIQWLEQQYRAVNTVNPQHCPKLFTRNPTVWFLEVDEACVDIFGILPRFLKSLLESEMWFVLLRPGRKPHWDHSALIQLFRGIFFQGTWQHNCQLFENSKTASWAAQKALVGHVRLAGHVFETPGLYPWDSPICDVRITEPWSWSRFAEPWSKFYQTMNEVLLDCGKV